MDHPHPVEVEHLRKELGGSVVVDDVSFAVPAGMLVALLGPNGAGKTTIVHCLTTLLAPDGGTARIAGFDVRTEPDRVRESIALTGQFTAVDEVLTGRQNLVLFGRLLGRSRRSAAERADELLERFSLQEPADRAVGSYSGGMRRELDVAVSLVVDRPVLVLDEPTTGLDPRSRREFWVIIRELCDAGTTVLLTTHYLEQADRHSDRIVILDRGRLIDDGTPEELKDRVGGMAWVVRITDPADRERARRALAGQVADVVDDTILLGGTASGQVVVDVLRVLEAAGVVADEIALRRPTLDEVFFSLTGEHAPAQVPPVPEGATR